VNVAECRRLVAFFEALEKSLVNAWDGGGSINW
jgi:hypothetical protein